MGVSCAGRKPQSEKGLCAALLRHIYSSASDEQIADIMAQRYDVADDEKPSLLFEGDHLDCCEHLLDDEDRQDFKKQREALRSRQKAKGTEPPPAEPPAPAAAAAAPAPPAPAALAAARPTISLRGAHTPAEAKEWIPQVPGASIRLDDVRHKRWGISYPRAEPPRSYSKAYGDESVVTKAQSLRMCLVQIWTWHEEATGERCPIDFEV